MRELKMLDDKNFLIDLNAIPSRAASHLQSCDQLISEKQRKLLVKKLYHGEASRLAHLFNVLEAAPDWRAANRILQEHFKTCGIDSNRKEARLLSDLIYQRYFPNDVPERR